MNFWGIAMTYPEYIKKCIALLERGGFLAYVVGGAVRDGLLGRQAHDWDVATSARPEQIMAVFEGFRTIPTGIKHGTVTVLLDEENGSAVPVEITTFRIDGEYLDNRRPSEVIFAPSVEDDLSRRDFTVNAMAYNEKEGLVDCFSGKADLEERLIRCVGEPEVRYSEDALRILRAFRFAAQLDFEIEERTLAATSSCAHLLKNIARERIGVEFLKLIASDGARYALEALVKTGVFSALFDFVPTPDKEAIENVLKLEGGDPFARLAALILSYGEEKRHEFIGSLRLSNDQKRLVLRLCGAAVFELPEDAAERERSARRFLALYNNICESALEMLCALSRGDLSDLEAFADTVRAEKEKGRCLQLSSLAVSGADILPLCADDPSRVGKILSLLLADVIDEPSHNDRDHLIQLEKKLI